jgi:PAS domain S-box-containing protein
LKTNSIDYQLRKSGIEAIGDVQWGTHFCQFYRTKKDLIDILVPYFKAGLENNEFCMWVTSIPLKVEDAKQSLRKAVKNLDDLIRKGQIEILDYSQWYTRSGKFNSGKVLKGWVEKERQALEKRFHGLRLTGNTFWLEKNGWKAFTEYEAEVNSVIGQHKMIALCTYSLDRCDACEIIDVVNNHEFALVRREGKWERIESVSRKTERKKSEEHIASLSKFPAENPNPVLRLSRDSAVLYGNDASKPLLDDWKCSVGANVPKFLRDIVTEALATGSMRTIDVESHGHTYSIDIVPIIDAGYVNLYAKDNTKRKIVERALKESEEKYRRIVETTEEGIWVSDPNGKTIYTNQKMADMLGYAREEIIGGVGAEFLMEGQESAITETRQKLEKRKRIQHEFQFRRKDGTALWTLANASPILDEEGQHINNLYMHTDITERKKAEQSIIAAKQEWERTFDSIPDPIAILDTKHRIIHANKSMAQRLGVNANQCLGLNCFKSVHGFDEPPSFCPHSLTIADGKEHIAEVHEDNLGGDFIVSTTPLFDEQGQITGAVHVARDITERKHMEKALLQTEADLLRAQTIAHTGSWRLDLERDQLNWSKETYRIFGIPDGTPMTYESFLATVYPDDRRFIEKSWKGALRGEPYDIEHRIVVNGDVKWVRERAEVELDRQGKVISGFGAVQDITERKELEKMRDQFISAVTHELRTPLVSIKGYTDYLLTGKVEQLSPKLQSSLSVIKQASDRLLDLTNQLLDYRRLVDGKFQLTPKPLDLKEVIESCAREIQPFIKEKKQMLQLDIPQKRLCVEGDETRLIQVFMNLLNNASKYASENGSITLQVRQETGLFKIKVSDTGMGIKAEDLDRVFEPFAAIQKPSYVKGTGLGLSVTKGLVEAHGGHIWAESQGLGKGSTFIFTIPVRNIG